MNRKFFYLMKMSLKKKLLSKWFFAVNLLLAIAIIALCNINSIITFFGGDFNDTTNILVIDDSFYYPLFSKELENLVKVSNTSNIKIKKINKEESVAKNKLKDDDILVVLEKDEKEILKAKIISQQKIDGLTYQMLSQSLNSIKQQIGFQMLNVDPILFGKIQKEITLERVVLNNEKNQDENMELIMSTVFPTIVLPFFLLIVFLVSMIGGEICEEKTTKSMEIIISNVSPKTHLLSKVLASNIFIFIQGMLFFIYGFIGLFISSRGKGLQLPSEVVDIWNSLVGSGFLNTLKYFLPIMLILMLLSFLAYSLFAAILASMTTNMEDFQQIQTPVMLILVVGYYLSIISTMFNGSLFIRIISYFPFLSCLVSPSLFMMGQIGISDVILSILILLLFLFVLLKYGLKIYKIGILNYSNEKVWHRFVKAFKTKEN